MSRAKKSEFTPKARRYFKDYIDLLNSREREIFKIILEGKPMPYVAMAKRLGVSAGRAHQLHAKVLREFRFMLRLTGLIPSRPSQ